MKKWVFTMILFVSLFIVVNLFLDEKKVYKFLNISKEPGKSLQRTQKQYHKLMKPKYIWFIMDAWGSYLSGNLSSFSNHSAFYHIKNNGYPQSAAIAATQFLSRPSQNYVGEYLSEETIFDQINNFDTNLISHRFPVLSLLGSNRFKNITIIRGREGSPLNRINYNAQMPDYNQFITTNASSMTSARDLVEVLSNNKIKEIKPENVYFNLVSVTKKKRNNLVYYSSFMDSCIHNFGGLSAKTIKSAATVLSFIKSFIRAIESSDHKDEYVLIVSSDHGGQIYFGEDEICNHGCKMDGGNEGFLYIYSYGTGKFEDWIENFDVGAIIAGYITNASIPLFATGWPRPIANEGISYLDEFLWLAYKAKESQLLDLMNLNTTSDIKDIDLFYEYLKALESTAFKNYNHWWLNTLLGILGTVIVIRVYKIIGIKILGFFVEHVIILLFVTFGRIENLLFYPIFMMNFLYFVIEVYSYSWTRVKMHQIRLKILLYKSFEFIKSQTSSLVLLLNMIHLLLKSENYDPNQIYSYYYLHYCVFFVFLVKYTNFLPLVYKVLTILIIASLLSLMIYYEAITDYTMTDQTEDMISIIRLFYILLLLFAFFLVFFPNSIEKRKILGIPLVILYFFIASQSERSYLVFFYLISLYFLISKDDYILILVLACTSFVIMNGTFGFDISLRAGNKSWGVNPDQFPIFTGFIFGVHKLSWYMIAGCGILASNCFDKVFEPLTLRALAALMIFLHIFYSSPVCTLSGFMWSVSQCLTLIFSHSLGLLVNTNVHLLKTVILPNDLVKSTEV